MRQVEPRPQDNRRYVRMNTVFPVIVQTFPFSHATSIQGFTRDISENGLCVEVKTRGKEIAVGQTLVLEIDDHNEKLIKAEGIVKWLTAEPHLKLGIEYQQISKELRTRLWRYAKKRRFYPLGITLIVLAVLAGTCVSAYHGIKFQARIHSLELQLDSLAYLKKSIDEDYVSLEYYRGLQESELKGMREHLARLEEMKAQNVLTEEKVREYEKNLSDSQGRQQELEVSLEYIRQQKIRLVVKLEEIDKELKSVNQDLVGYGLNKKVTEGMFDELKLVNGNSLLGTILKQDETEIIFAYHKGGQLVVKKSEVALVGKAALENYEPLELTWPLAEKEELTQGPENPLARQALTWITKQQQDQKPWVKGEHPLIANEEDGIDCYTYDQALSVVLFSFTGDIPLAKKILQFYADEYEAQTKTKGRFSGFPDFYRKNGYKDMKCAGGPNAWMIIAINNYTRKSNDKTYLPLACHVADWLMLLQNANGGVKGGYESETKPMTWVSTEHNLDAYAALKVLGELAGQPKYTEAAQKILNWLGTVAWNPQEKRFNLGEKDSNFATDVSAWAVLVLGDEYSVTLDFAEDKSLNRQFYEQGKSWVEGFDFGATYRDGPYPDKDSVWFEGTAHMSLAYYRVQNIADGDYYRKEMEKVLTDSQKFSFAKALPQASNRGTPAYGGWMMSSEKLSVAPTIWYLFSNYRFNPFYGESI